MKDKCILICEDDEGITDIAQIVLESNSYKVVVDSGSPNIYNKITEIKPDLILLDLWMPGLNGEEITRQLKADPQTRRIPIVIISANTDTAQIAKDSGAEAFLAKPFDISDLENIVDTCLAL